ncbi:hypothetical protein CRE_10983 [Caenorhabditis remanei]|uniref:Uncharacterized protein n=1 Tax=Caenorhabditis remanei TaxID=31234 RepID=E3M5V2_CAERE|nr:hypothetical protein CRE_10983 [Caenorhabditis remanei]
MHRGRRQENPQPARVRVRQTRFQRFVEWTDMIKNGICRKWKRSKRFLSFSWDLTSSRNFTSSSCSCLLCLIYLAHKLYGFNGDLMKAVGLGLKVAGIAGILVGVYGLVMSSDEHITEALSLLYYYTQAKSSAKLNFFRLLLEFLETWLGTTICLILFSTGISNPVQPLLIASMILVCASIFTSDRAIVYPIRRPHAPPAARIEPNQQVEVVDDNDEADEDDEAVGVERNMIGNPIVDHFR